MSYYADINVRFKVSKENTDVIFPIIKSHDLKMFFNEEESVFYHSSYDKCDYDNWEHFANEVAPFVEEGEIDFDGDDDAHWRFIFRDGHCDYEDAILTYEHIDHYRELIEKMSQYIANHVGDAWETVAVFKDIGFDDDDLDKFGLNPAD